MISPLAIEALSLNDNGLTVEPKQNELHITNDNNKPVKLTATPQLEIGGDISFNTNTITLPHNPTTIKSNGLNIILEPNNITLRNDNNTPISINGTMTQTDPLSQDIQEQFEETKTLNDITFEYPLMIYNKIEDEVLIQTTQSSIKRGENLLLNIQSITNATPIYKLQTNSTQSKFVNNVFCCSYLENEDVVYIWTNSSNTLALQIEPTDNTNIYNETDNLINTTSQYITLCYSYRNKTYEQDITLTNQTLDSGVDIEFEIVDGTSIIRPITEAIIIAVYEREAPTSIEYILDYSIQLNTPYNINIYVEPINANQELICNNATFYDNYWFFKSTNITWQVKLNPNIYANHEFQESTNKYEAKNIIFNPNDPPQLDFKSLNPIYTDTPFIVAFLDSYDNSKNDAAYYTNTNIKFQAYYDDRLYTGYYYTYNSSVVGQGPFVKPEILTNQTNILYDNMNKFNNAFSISTNDKPYMYEPNEASTATINDKTYYYLQWDLNNKHFTNKDKFEFYEFLYNSYFDLTYNNGKFEGYNCINNTSAQTSRVSNPDDDYCIFYVRNNPTMKYILNALNFTGDNYADFFTPYIKKDNFYLLTVNGQRAEIKDDEYYRVDYISTSTQGDMFKCQFQINMNRDDLLNKSYGWLCLEIDKYITLKWEFIKPYGWWQYNNLFYSNGQYVMCIDAINYTIKQTIEQPSGKLTLYMDYELFINKPESNPWLFIMNNRYYEVIKPNPRECSTITTDYNLCSTKMIWADNILTMNRSLNIVGTKTDILTNDLIDVNNRLSIFQNQLDILNKQSVFLTDFEKVCKVANSVINFIGDVIYFIQTAQDIISIIGDTYTAIQNRLEGRNELSFSADNMSMSSFDSNDTQRFELSYNADGFAEYFNDLSDSSDIIISPSEAYTHQIVDTNEHIMIFNRDGFSINDYTPYNGTITKEYMQQIPENPIYTLNYDKGILTISDNKNNVVIKPSDILINGQSILNGGEGSITKFDSANNTVYFDTKTVNSTLSIYNLQFDVDTPRLIDDNTIYPYNENISINIHYIIDTPEIIEVVDITLTKDNITKIGIDEVEYTKDGKTFIWHKFTGLFQPQFSHKEFKVRSLDTSNIPENITVSNIDETITDSNNTIPTSFAVKSYVDNQPKETYFNETSETNLSINNKYEYLALNGLKFNDTVLTIDNNKQIIEPVAILCYIEGTVKWGVDKSINFVVNESNYQSVQDNVLHYSTANPSVMRFNWNLESGKFDVDVDASVVQGIYTVEITKAIIPSNGKVRRIIAYTNNYTALDGDSNTIDEALPTVYFMRNYMAHKLLKSSNLTLPQYRVLINPTNPIKPVNTAAIFFIYFTAITQASSPSFSSFEQHLTEDDITDNTDEYIEYTTYSNVWKEDTFIFRWNKSTSELLPFTDNIELNQFGIWEAYINMNEVKIIATANEIKDSINTADDIIPTINAINNFVNNKFDNILTKEPNNPTVYAAQSIYTFNDKANFRFNNIDLPSDVQCKMIDNQTVLPVNPYAIIIFRYKLKSATNYTNQPLIIQNIKYIDSQKIVYGTTTEYISIAWMKESGKFRFMNGDRFYDDIYDYLIMHVNNNSIYSSISYVNTTLDNDTNNNSIPTSNATKQYVDNHAPYNKLNNNILSIYETNDYLFNNLILTCNDNIDYSYYINDGECPMNIFANITGTLHKEDNTVEDITLTYNMIDKIQNNDVYYKYEDWIIEWTSDGLFNAFNSDYEEDNTWFIIKSITTQGKKMIIKLVDTNLNNNLIDDVNHSIPTSYAVKQYVDSKLISSNSQTIDDVNKFIDDVNEVFESQNQRITQLENEVKELKQLINSMINQ